MELETRVQAAEDARRQISDQLDEVTTKQQRDIAKQVDLHHHHHHHYHHHRRRSRRRSRHFLLKTQSVSQTYTYIYIYIYILDGVPPVHVVSKHVVTDKLTTANGGTFTSSSARLSSQLRYSTLVTDVL